MQPETATLAAIARDLLTTIKELCAAFPVLATQPVQPQSSVEISRNAKGAAQWTVKAYAADAAAASELAQALYDELAARYAQEVVAA
jgi:hypothetical protein